MGKAKILSGSDGAYLIQYYYGNRRAKTEIDKLEKENVEIDKKIGETITKRDEQYDLADALVIEINGLIDTYRTCLEQVPVCSTAAEQKGAISKKIESSVDAKALAWAFANAVRILQADKISNRQRIAYLSNHAPLTEGPLSWSSADNIDDSTALVNTYVGTIDVMAGLNNPTADPPLPIVHNLIRPLYTSPAFSESRDKPEARLSAMTEAQAAYAVATWPYAVKYNPRYLVGTITSTNKAANTAGVDCWGATDTGNIPPNFPSPLSLQNVPVEYMACHASAFKIGDKVIVEFTDPSKAGAKIIGFLHNPRKCPVFNGWRIHNGKYVHSSYDPGGQWDWTPNAGAGGNHSWSGGIGSDRCTLSWWGRDGKHCGPLTYYTTSVYYNSTTLTFPYAVFGAFAKKEAGVWWVYAYCRDMTYYTNISGVRYGTGNMEYWYKRKRDGTGTTTTVWSGANNTYEWAIDSADLSAVQKHSVWANASGTRAVGMYRRRQNDRYEDDDADYGPRSTRWWDFSTDPPTQTWEVTSSFLTYPGNPTKWENKIILAYEWDGDQPLAIEGYQGYGSHSLNATDVDYWAEIRVTCGERVLFERQATAYKRGNYTDYTANSMWINIFALTAESIAYVLVLKETSSALDNTYPWTLLANSKVVGLDGTILANQDATLEAATQPFGAESGGGTWFRGTDYSYIRGYEATAERLYIAFGPDGKYVMDANKWKWYPLDYYYSGTYYGWGGFYDTSERIFSSNDITKASFEAASGATQPYNGRVAVI
jgi:hypothetical protein